MLSGRLELLRWSSADSRARVTVGVEAATLLMQPRNDIPIIDRFRSKGGYQLGSAVSQLSPELPMGGRHW